MVYNEAVKKAMNIAVYLHNGQLDRGGYPYMHHLMHVAEQFTTTDEVIVALLHDSVEDYGDHAWKLIDIGGFNAQVIHAISAITRRQNETYDEYIDRLSQNRLATRVKIEDLRHNMNKTRAVLSDSLHKRYKKAFKKLTDLEANRYGS